MREINPWTGVVDPYHVHCELIGEDKVHDLSRIFRVIVNGCRDGHWDVVGGNESNHLVNHFVIGAIDELHSGHLPVLVYFKIIQHVEQVFVEQAQRGE